jgi:hypothetical protein
MNGWLIGLCIAVMVLWIRQLGSVYRWSKLVQTLSAFTEIVGTLGGIPQENIEESRKVWTEARITAEKQLALTSVLVFAVAIFLTALMIHGKI